MVNSAKLVTGYMSLGTSLINGRPARLLDENNGGPSQVRSRTWPNGCRGNRIRNAGKEERIPGEGRRNLREDVIRFSPQRSRRSRRKNKDLFCDLIRVNRRNPRSNHLRVLRVIRG